MGTHTCPTCQKIPGRKFEFSTKTNLVRHTRNFHQASRFPCATCGKVFQNRYHLTAHIKTAHNNMRAETLGRDFSFDMLEEFEEEPPTATCPFCTEQFPSPYQLRGHWQREHQEETGNAIFNNMEREEERERYIEQCLRSQPQLFILPLVKESTHENAKFKLAQHNYTLSFNELGLEAVKMAYGSELVAAVFTYVVEELKKQCVENEKSFIGFTINADCLDTALNIPFCQAKDFSAEQVLEAIFALGTSDKYIEVDDNLSIQLTTLNLQPPDTMTFGVVSPANFRGASRLEQLARKTSLYGFTNVVRPYDCALVAFALSQKIREVGKKFRRDAFFKNTKLTNFEFSASELGQKCGPKPSRMLATTIARLVVHFETDFNFHRPQGMKFLKRLQKHMDKCITTPQQLVVFKDKEFDAPLFAGATLRPFEDRVYFLYLENSHICLIADPKQFFRQAKFWDCCLNITMNRKHHKCSSEEGRFCLKCGGRSCWGSKPARPDLVCDNCQTFFDRHDCYVAHGTGRPPRCETHATCSRCLTIWERKEPYSTELKPHKCLSYKCRHCGGEFEATGINPHLCTYQEPKEPALGGMEKPFYRIYWDMETCVRGVKRELVPYLTCAIFVCSKCIEDLEAPETWQKSYPCCGRRRRSYWFREGLRRFLRDTFQTRKGMKRGIASAYNMRNFDGYFLLRNLLATGASPKNIVTGNRLMSIKFNQVQVKDLNLYTHGPLAGLPASFGLGHLVSKGHFPHLLANELSFDEMLEHQSPVHPPLDMYAPSRAKSEKELAELREWHASVADQPFRFAEEAVKYCMQDCVVLALCAERLEETILEFTDGDISLLNSTTFTLASQLYVTRFAAQTPISYTYHLYGNESARTGRTRCKGLTMTIFRHMYMEVPIGIVPQSGYTPGQTSTMANLWFMYLNQKRDQSNRARIHFAHNTTGGEFRCDRKRVDGYCPQSGVFYEFHGCYWHGCKECFSDAKAIHPTYKVPYYAVRARDMRRIKSIQTNYDTRIVIFKECKVRQLLKDKISPFCNFYKEHKLLVETVEPVTVRGALAGGRTEVFAPYKELTADEIRQGYRIVHIDVHSLYPWAQCNNYFPSTPHPTPIEGSSLRHEGYGWGADDVRQYFGIFSVCLMYRQTPFYPPIPYKTRGKGVYGCCKACMEKGEDVLFCHHTKELHRAIKVELTSVDLELALENGAVLLRIYSILDYGRANITKEMYRSMMMPLVKGKLVAKGRAGRSRQQLEQMAEKWAEAGIHLDPDEFGDFKPALYLVYKLLMNSLWGKQAQMNRSQERKIVTNPTEAAGIIWDPLRRVKNVTSIGVGDSVLVETEVTNSEHLDEHSIHNPLVAAFVTAYGRRALFQGLVKCGKRALYCDTDSIVYISSPEHRPSEPYIDPHGLLGSWVNELKDTQFIRVFVATAPKCYQYMICAEDDPLGKPVGVKCRMKGLGLNAALRSNISLETMHAMAVRLLEELRGHYELVLDSIAASTSEDYVAAARAKTRLTGALHLPQTKLDKIGKHLQILDKSAEASKMLRFRFDKRVLQREYLSLTFIPSIPFGTRSHNEVFCDI